MVALIVMSSLGLIPSCGSLLLWLLSAMPFERPGADACKHASGGWRKLA